MAKKTQQSAEGEKYTSSTEMAKRKAIELLGQYMTRREQSLNLVVRSVTVNFIQYVKEHFYELFREVDTEDQAIIKEIAKKYTTEQRRVAIEYMATSIMFTAIEEYFHLKKEKKIEPENVDGFILLTKNGSLIIGGVPKGKKHKRAIHYIRLQSRRSRNIQERYEFTLENTIYIDRPFCERDANLVTTYVQSLLSFSHTQAPCDQQIGRILREVSEATEKAVTG